MAEEEKKLSIDETLAELSRIVDRLSDEEVPLEEALASFEDGVKMVKSANEILSGMEDKLRILTGNGETDDI